MKVRKSRSAIMPAAPAEFDDSHARRIVQKMIEGGSATADFANSLHLSGTQSKKARLPRSSALVRVLTVIMKSKPRVMKSEGRIDYAMLFVELEKLRGDGVIESVSDDVIEWTDDNRKAQTTGIANLKKNAMPTARKLLKKSDSG